MRRFLFSLIVRPLVMLVLGMNTRHYERLPKQGPCVVVANHNSHLDTLVLMTLFKGAAFDKVRPVAAADYFFKNKFLAWFSTKVMNIIPIERKMTRDIKGLFAPMIDALDNDGIIIVFPEGSRGEAEKLSRYKSGVYYLMRERPDIPIVPVFLHGLGKALPKGSFFFIPIIVDIFIGESFKFNPEKGVFMDTLNTEMAKLQQEGHFKEW